MWVADDIDTYNVLSVDSSVGCSMYVYRSEVYPIPQFDIVHSDTATVLPSRRTKRLA
jgi:hypothetical protein